MATILSSSGILILAFGGLALMLGVLSGWGAIAAVAIGGCFLIVTGTLLARSRAW